MDEETFTDIAVMYADGLIGNRGILDVLGLLTTAQFNKMLPSGKAPYTLNQIIPKAHDYIYPPLSDNEKKNLVSDQLLAFAMMSPGAPKHWGK